MHIKVNIENILQSEKKFLKSSILFYKVLKVKSEYL